MYVLPVVSRHFVLVTSSEEAVLTTFLPQYGTVYMVPPCFATQTQTEN